MCGPSGAQGNISGEQTNFFNELQSSYATNFGGQQGILSSLNNALSPIINAGPSQNGFSAAENAALTGGAINSAAAANRNAQTIAGANAGGNTGVTTGGQKQLQAEIASGVGQNLASNENQIALAGANQGRSNFFGAVQGLSGVAQQYNPNATAGVANNAGNNAFGSATEIANMKNQEEADIGGAVAGVALAPFTGGLSLGALGGLAGGSKDDGTANGTIFS